MLHTTLSWTSQLQRTFASQRPRSIRRNFDHVSDGLSVCRTSFPCSCGMDNSHIWGKETRQGSDFGALKGSERGRYMVLQCQNVVVQMSAQSP